jgi:hypothetical protein
MFKDLKFYKNINVESPTYLPQKYMHHIQHGFSITLWHQMVSNLIKGLMLFGYEPICFDFHIGTSNSNNKNKWSTCFTCWCAFISIGCLLKKLLDKCLEKQFKEKIIML